jgi:hypothetical protein
MRPETTLILSSIDSRTLAEFPPELDPCVNEALRNEAIVEAVKGVWKPLAAGGGGVLGEWKPLTAKDFGGSELVEDNLPESLTAWYTAACSGRYDIHLEKHTPVNIRGRYKASKCEMGPTGSHGGCSYCLMCKVRWEPTPAEIAAIKEAETPVTPPEPERVFMTADDVRHADVNTREAVARAIQRVTIPQAVALSTPTAIQGVVIPKLETGLPQMPVVIPLLALQGVEIKPEGMNMIEFQEIIPGIKPPSIPSLIPGLEKLPLLPGWTIRDPAGKILNEGVRMPLVPPIGATGIAIPPELPTEGGVAPPIVDDSKLNSDAVTLEKLLLDSTASEDEIADIAVELGLELEEDGSSLDEEIEL